MNNNDRLNDRRIANLHALLTAHLLDATEELCARLERNGEFEASRKARERLADLTETACAVWEEVAGVPLTVSRGLAGHHGVAD